MSSERTTRETRFIVYERDEHGSAFAIEIVEAERWTDAFREPPDPERADARIVRLGSDELIPEIPRWLAVEPLQGGGGGERRDASLRVAETDAEYRTRETEEEPAADRGAADLQGSLGGQLWPWSPTYRPPGPVPAELQRRIEVLIDFAAERPPPFAQLATLQGAALERWLRYNFDDPDDLADTILLERMSDDGASEAVEALRFLRASRVPSSLTQYAELAIDRRVLLEQASPWRYFDGAPFQSAISAVQAWRRRYRLAYDQHYRSCQRSIEDAARALEEATLAASALERLDRLQTLGPPVGSLALAALSEARTAIGAVPREPDPDAAQTGGVTLGLEPPPVAGTREAIANVSAALELQRRRLASETVRAILSRPGVPALDQLLQAIAASDLDAIERVMDDELAAHIDRLLTQPTETPLARMAMTFPTVTSETLEQAVSAWRALLEEALAQAPDDRLVLREDRS